MWVPCFKIRDIWKCLRSQFGLQNDSFIIFDRWGVNRWGSMGRSPVKRRSTEESPYGFPNPAYMPDAQSIHSGQFFKGFMRKNRTHNSLRPVYIKRQRQRCDDAWGHSSLWNQWKQIVSLQNGVATRFGVTPLISMTAMSQALSQRWRLVHMGLISVYVKCYYPAHINQICFSFLSIHHRFMLVNSSDFRNFTRLFLEPSWFMSVNKINLRKATQFYCLKFNCKMKSEQYKTLIPIPHICSFENKMFKNWQFYVIKQVIPEAHSHCLICSQCWPAHRSLYRQYPIRIYHTRMCPTPPWWDREHCQELVSLPHCPY